VIIDLAKFSAAERPAWQELEAMLNRIEDNPGGGLTLEQAKKLHYLYERASADLARVITFSAEPELRRYLETLVARAYSEIHETRDRRSRFSAVAWFMRTLPQTFRRHIRAFYLALSVVLAGAAFGGFALAFDPEAKQAVMPEMFANHLGDPAERVRREEQAKHTPTAGQLTPFSTQLMTHNIRQAINALALGMTAGIGTLLVLFYNGVILGVIGLDYVLAGQTKFLLAWLMPHGVIEIPAFVIAGQAGLVLANALIGWGRRERLAHRFRAVVPDLVTLIGGVAVMLIWAGLVEAFLSQYHEPLIPYWSKIAFGTVELALLILFLARAGRKHEASSSVDIRHSSLPST
jgi:uncharacterized membrane protein SpoIIM required for sporulation